MKNLKKPPLLSVDAAPAGCVHCPIRARAVCSQCDANDLNALNRIKSYRTYEAGQEIVGAGQPLDFVGSIVKGTVKLSKSLADGRRQIVGLLFPSDFVGRSSRVFADHDAIAGTEVTLCSFRRGPFEELMATTPRLEQRMLEMTLDELDAAREWLLLLGRKTAREKVASFLLLVVLRSLERREGETRYQIPLSREDMADYLGLTIETVSRQISKMKREGIVQIDGHRDMSVPDLDLLFIAAGDDADGAAVP